MHGQEPADKIADILDLIRESASHNVTIRGPDDQPTFMEQIHHSTIWWKTHSVNSERFARMALELEDFARLANEAYRRMSKERADIIATQILEIVIAFKHSIDAKSSESRRDGQNAQATLLDRVGRNKVEHVYSSKDMASRSLLDGMLGRRKDSDLDSNY